MNPTFRLASHHLSRAFWATVLGHCADDLATTERAIRADFQRAEEFRRDADFDTGSIGLASALCLHAVARYFQVSTVAEVGTFIGKSTSALASGMARPNAGGVIYTCDKDNACFRPSPEAGCSIVCFERKTSTAMFEELAQSEEKVDLFFFDGRIADADIPLILKLSHAGSLYLFDDFEGTEKGTVNALKLRSALREHVLVEPCQGDLLRAHGIPGRSLIAGLLNIAQIRLTNQ